MPSSWLNVPHFRQEFEYSCVPACVRRVLAHYGDNRSEAELRLLLDTQPGRQRGIPDCFLPRSARVSQRSARVS